LFFILVRNPIIIIVIILLISDSITIIISTLSSVQRKLVSSILDSITIGI
jgi:hypothetical protein